MALSSMTGFARGQGGAGSYAWAWELKSVNSKGLDLKLRLPPGWEAIEPGVRARASEALSRGSVFANLTVSREGTAPVARINEPAVFMHRIGVLKSKPESWKDLYFAELHGGPGD